MTNKNYIEINKIILAGWVDKTLDQRLWKKKSSQGSKVNGFGHWILKPLMREQGLVAYI
jgi:hypothetical protein